MIKAQKNTDITKYWILLMGGNSPKDVAQLGLDINRALFHKRGDELITLIAQYMKEFDMTANCDVISKIPVGGTGENIA